MVAPVLFDAAFDHADHRQIGKRVPRRSVASIVTSAPIDCNRSSSSGIIANGSLTSSTPATRRELSEFGESIVMTGAVLRRQEGSRPTSGSRCCARHDTTSPRTLTSTPLALICGRSVLFLARRNADDFDGVDDDVDGTLPTFRSGGHSLRSTTACLLPRLLDWRAWN